MIHALSAALLLSGPVWVGLTPASATSASDTAASADTSCTIRGTAGADVLVGTPNRDVLCGRGGNDVLRGRGGDDLLVGGGGADRLLGGAGADELVSGRGADEVSGGAGADLVRSGDEADVVAGGDGADVLQGGSGMDRLAGGLGADRLVGAAGGDLLTGAAGSDTVLGGGGNDDLDGGPQPDTLDGGEGTNWCTVDAEDIQERCVYDLAAPQAVEVTVSSEQVDVTHADQQVVVRVHATDDTGVRSVRISHGPDIEQFPIGPAELESGTVRDGWWTATLNFRRWSEPGTYQFQIRVSDRVSRVTTTDFADPTIEVRDDNPDREFPQVELLEPTPDATYDVRTQYAEVVVRARLTDAVSGVDYAEACIHEPLIDGRIIALYCSSMRLRSGDIRDGVWRADLGIDEGAVDGHWNVEIYTNDRAHAETWQDQSWVGPDLWAAGAGSNSQPFPNGMGRFTVIGVPRNDDTPPSVVSASATPSEVDTLPGPATVDLAVHATDAEGGGVTGVGVQLLSTDPDGPQDLYVSLELQSGSPLDGIWTDPIVLPQGTPPGTYYLKVNVWDAVDHHTYYMTSGHPDSPSYEPLPGDPTVTVVDSTQQP